MFGIGSGELLIILVIAVLVVGPEKMVEFSAQLGRIIAKLRAETSDVTREFRESFDLELGETAGKNGAPARPNFQAPPKGGAARPALAGAPAAEAAAAQAAAAEAAEDSPPGAAAETPATVEPPAADAATAAPTPAPIVWTGPLAQEEPEPEADGGEFAPSAEDLAVQPVDISVGELVVEDEEVQPVELDGPLWVPTDASDTTPISEEESA